VIPIHDSVPTRSFAVVTATLIAVNSAVWLFYQVPQLQASVFDLGFLPCEVDNSCPDPGVQ
jgi:hypothetical protein